MFRAAEVASGQPCAVKILRAAHLSSRFGVRFIREARGLAGLRHPNVVRALGSGMSPGGLPFIAMELVEGKTLDALVGPRHPAAFVAATLRQVAAGLAAGHAKGIVHRDLKPRNLMISRQSYRFRVRVLDFGIARFSSDPELTRITASGSLLGSPAFMAPDQIRNPSDVDPRDDLYALGIVGYALVSGAIPFSGQTARVLHAQLSQEPPRLPELHGIDDLVHALLQKSRDRRPASAGAVIARLDQMFGAPGDDSGESEFQGREDTLETIPEVALTRALPTELLIRAPPPAPLPPARKWLWVLNGATASLAAAAALLLLLREPADRRTASKILEPSVGSSTSSRVLERPPEVPVAPLTRSASRAGIAVAEVPATREAPARLPGQAPDRAPRREENRPDPSATPSSEQALSVGLEPLGLRLEELSRLPEVARELDAWRRATSRDELALREALIERVRAARIGDELLDAKLAALRASLAAAGSRSIGLAVEPLERDYLDLMSERPNADTQADRRRLARSIERVRARLDALVGSR